MDHVSKDEDYMLYALLAGGAPYLVRDGAYPNTDGAFDGEKISLEEMTERCRVVTELHEKNGTPGTGTPRVYDGGRKRTEE